MGLRAQEQVDPAALFLREGRVGVSSGLRFDWPHPAERPATGRGFVRVNFATRPDLIAEAVKRMTAATERAAAAAARAEI